jgi:hypothetical protein
MHARILLCEKRVVIAQNFQCKRNLEECIKFLNGMSL